MMNNRYVNIISWNINGCGNQIKRRKVLAYLKSKNADIAFIQESHIMGDEDSATGDGSVQCHVDLKTEG